MLFGSLLENRLLTHVSLKPLHLKHLRLRFTYRARRYLPLLSSVYLTMSMHLLHQLKWITIATATVLVLYG